MKETEIACTILSKFKEAPKCNYWEIINRIFVFFLEINLYLNNENPYALPLQNNT